MHPEQIPESVPDVIWREVDDGTVLVSPETGDIRVLNEVGGTIWQLIDGENSVAEIEARLQEQFDVPTTSLREDLYSFLTELSQRNLLTWKRPESPHS